MKETVMLDLETLLTMDVLSSAEWRREVAARHPDDARNMEAADMLDRIGAELEALEGTPLHQKLAGLYERSGDDCVGLVEVQSEMIKSVGFHSWPTSAIEFLTDLVERIELEEALASV
jgi:hypothetical protein